MPPQLNEALICFWYPNPMTECGGSLIAEQPASQPEDGGSTPTPPLHSLELRRGLRPQLQFRVEKLEPKVAKKFIEEFHYSRKCPTGLNYFYGAYLGDELYAVADYGLGGNMDRGLSWSRRTKTMVLTLDARDADGRLLYPLNCLELKRLCRRGAKGEARIALTRFLSICHKMLKREHHIRFIVSYSDPIEAGTVQRSKLEMDPLGPRGRKQITGHIYRAANFRYCGRGSPVSHTIALPGCQIAAPGAIVHRRVAYRYKQRWNAKHPGEVPMTMGQARAALKLEPVSTPAKECWFLDLH